jgi:Sulfatase
VSFRRGDGYLDGKLLRTSWKKPNILVIFGDDIGITNLSAYTHGLVGHHTPNIDRIAKEGTMFTDYYGENSCTAGRSTFITGQCCLRTGLSKVGAPGAPVGHPGGSISIRAISTRLRLANLIRTDSLRSGFPLSTQTDADTRSLVRSFLDVYPSATLWTSELHEMLLIGSRSPIELDAGRIAASFNQPEVRSAHREIGTASPAALLAS